MSDNSIQLSKTTRVIMANFAKISPSMILQPGKVLRVADAETGTVFARANIEEDFPLEFPIADINQLLKILNLAAMKDCKLIFHDNTDTDPKHMIIEGSGVSIKYTASSSLLVDLPPEEPSLDPASEDVSFESEVAHQALSDFKAACDTLGLTHCILKNESGQAYLVGQDPSTDVSNDYVLRLGKTEKGDCEVPVLVSMLKLVDSDYVLRANDNIFINATSRNGNIDYFISAESL